MIELWALKKWQVDPQILTVRLLMTTYVHNYLGGECQKAISANNVKTTEALAILDSTDSDRPILSSLIYSFSYSFKL